MTVSTTINDLVKTRLKEEMMKRKGHVSTSSPSEPVAADVCVDMAAVEIMAELPEGKVWASEVLGCSVPKNFPVTVLDVSTIPEQVRAFIPLVDKSYAVQDKEAAELLRAIETGDKILISGPTGSGKSSLVKHICALTNRPMVRLNMSGDIESSHIFGQLEVESGSTVWKDGAATEAVRYGAVLVNDEWDVTPPEIMFGYQWLMEDDGKLFLKEMPGSSVDKMITPHGEFRFICLGNTLGQGDDSGRYAGTNVQNSATLDRFQTTIKLGYLSADHERNVLKNAVPNLADTIIAKMVQLAKLIRDGVNNGSLNVTMSPRTLINWGRKVDAFADTHAALSVAYLNKLGEDDHKVVSELYRKVFG